MSTMRSSEELEQPTSRAGQVFDTMLSETMLETFKAVLGNTLGQALMDAVTKHASLKLEELGTKLSLVDQTFRVCMGSKPAKVMQKRILTNTIKKMVPWCAAPETDMFDFAAEVGNLRSQFIKHKQAADRPQALE